MCKHLGGVYCFGKPAHSARGLLDAVSSTCSPSSLAFSRENDSCNTNRPSTSVVTVIKNDSHMHVCVPSGYNLRVVSF